MIEPGGISLAEVCLRDQAARVRRAAASGSEAGRHKRRGCPMEVELQSIVVAVGIFEVVSLWLRGDLTWK